VIDAIGLLGLLALAFSGRGNGPAARPAPRGSGAPKQLPPAPAPWPAPVPDGLPKFPGAGWEFDEPPPVPVQQRAAQLVAPLWRQGKGSSRTEMTAGRWITYRAEIVRSGKQGVVAYRVKGGGTLKQPAPVPQLEQPQARAPSSPSSPKSSAMTLPMIFASTSPGWPQPMAGGRVVNVVAGHWYQWTARVDMPAGPGVAEGIARGLSLAGAVNIAVSTTPPYVVAYQLQAKQTVNVPLGVQIRFAADGVEGSITFLDAKEIAAPTGPKVPIEKPPGWVDVNVPAGGGESPGDIRIDVPGGTIYAKPGPAAERSPIEMPELKVGSRGEDVKLVQRKLGIDPDGVFGKGTQTAVIVFQQKTGLAPANQTVEQLRARGFGAVKQATWVKLFGVRV
jgi:hypothetical protein